MSMWRNEALYLRQPQNRQAQVLPRLPRSRAADETAREAEARRESKTPHVRVVLVFSRSATFPLVLLISKQDWRIGVRYATSFFETYDQPTIW